MARKLFFKHQGNAVSYAGLQVQGFNLNYIGDNALIGTFPFQFGSTVSDTFSGTYTFGDYSGSLSGNISTVLNASGTMFTDDLGSNTTSQTVSRLNTTQNINLSDGVTADAGNIHIVSALYYGAGDLFPAFIATTTTINVPFLSVNETFTTNLIAIPVMLGSPTFKKNTVTLWPNPVKDVLTLDVGNDISLKSIAIFDTNGRMIANTFLNTVDISDVSSGIYFAQIETDSGTIVKKIIKQ